MSPRTGTRTSESRAATKTSRPQPASKGAGSSRLEAGLALSATGPAPGWTYELLASVGEGGFGRVFAAARIDGASQVEQDVVCVKVTENKAAWHRECYFGELLRGNGRVVQVIDDFPFELGEGRHREQWYALVTEYAENGSLTSYLDELSAPWPEARIRKEVRGILQALDQLHKGHAMHRDLTPMNVLVTRSGRLKLGDFGISRHAMGSTTVDADAFNYGFVPTAMAVGDIQRWGAIDDVWQVGQLLAMLVRRDSEPISTRDVKQLVCSDDLKAIIRRAIGAKSNRYADAFALSEALGGTEAALPVGVRSLMGKRVVFTGTLWTRRADAAALVHGVGGTVTQDVSSNTDVLVCGEPSPHYIAKSKGMKRITAESLNERGAKIKIIREGQFRRLVRA